MINVHDMLQAKILIVDDLAANVSLLSRALTAAGYVSVDSTMAPQTVRDLHARNGYDLILLDLHMPVMDGFQVMEAVRRVEPGDYLPIIVITAQPALKLRALNAGAKDFISKPFDLAEVLARVHNMLETRLLYKELHSYNRMLESRIRTRTADIHDSHLETIFAMTRAAEYRDEDTGAHVQRISYYCRELSGQLGMDADFGDLIFFASPMHDIGKIGVQDSILLKPSSFTQTEWALMKAHTTMGAEILVGSKSPYLQMGAAIALGHHERWDGSGYPNGEWGENIPLAARIMNICDVYDALRSRRPYKSAYDHDAAMSIIEHGDGRTRPEHFDPTILDAFCRNQQVFRDIFEARTGSEAERPSSQTRPDPVVPLWIGTGNAVAASAQPLS